MITTTAARLLALASGLLLLESRPLVLGPERCGAVSAALDAESGGGGGHGHDAPAVASHIPALVKALHDAVAEAKGKPGDAVENTVLANIRIVTRDLPVQSPMLAEHVKAGTLQVIGMRYDLDTGAVTPVDAATAEKQSPK